MGKWDGHYTDEVNNPQGSTDSRNWVDLSLKKKIKLETRLGDCSSKGPRFNSYNPDGSSQLYVTPVPGDYLRPFIPMHIKNKNKAKQQQRKKEQA